jgi:hypothetical protein
LGRLNVGSVGGPNSFRTENTYARFRFPINRCAACLHNVASKKFLGAQAA